MKLTKKWKLLLAAGIVVVVALTGCGKKEEVSQTYTSKSGNYSIDIPGENFEEIDKGENALDLNNGKYAYGVLQISKAELEEQGIFTLDTFSEEALERIKEKLSVKEAPEVKVKVSNMSTAKGWKLDMTDTLKTQALLVFGETEKAYYQFMAECAKSDYNEKKFISILGTLKEINIPELPQEELQTYSSNSGGFTIELPGEWKAEDTGMGAVFSRSNVAVKVERISKEQAAGADISDFESFVSIVNSDSSNQAETQFEPGKFKAAKAFIDDQSNTSGTKQLFVYLESENSYLSFSIGAPSEGYDKLVEKYSPVIQGIVEE